MKMSAKWIGKRVQGFVAGVEIRGYVRHQEGQNLLVVISWTSDPAKVRVGQSSIFHSSQVSANEES